MNFTHINEQGRAHMVDVTDKDITSVADSDVTIVVNNGSLQHIADGDTSFLLQFRSEDAVRVVGLFDESVQSTVAAGAQLILVKIGVGSHVLCSGQNK